jgi:hypothetical protein
MTPFLRRTSSSVSVSLTFSMMTQPTYARVATQDDRLPPEHNRERPKPATAGDTAPSSDTTFDAPNIIVRLSPPGQNDNSYIHVLRIVHQWPGLSSIREIRKSCPLAGGYCSPLAQLSRARSTAQIIDPSSTFLSFSKVISQNEN